MLLELCDSFDAASQVLKKHEEEFFDVVNPKLNLLWLKRKEVISESLITEIKAADTRDAKEILFEHLHCNADVAALTEYCKMVIYSSRWHMYTHTACRIHCSNKPSNASSFCIFSLPSAAIYDHFAVLRQDQLCRRFLLRCFHWEAHDCYI